MLSGIQKLFPHQVIGTVFFVAVLLVLKTEVPANAANENQIEATGQVENIQTDENSQVYIPMPGKHRVSLPILRETYPIMAQDKADTNEQADDGAGNVASEQADEQADDGAGNVASEQADEQADDGAGNVASEQADEQADDGAGNVASEQADEQADDGAGNVASEQADEQADDGAGNVASEQADEQADDGAGNVAEE